MNAPQIAVRFVWLSIATALLSAAASTQTRPRASIGLHAAYRVGDFDQGAVGGHAILDLPAGFALYPAFQWYVVESGHRSRGSIALRWMRPRAVVAPYVGVGPYWTQRSTGGLRANDRGLVGQIGAEARMSNVRTFAEIQFLTKGGTTAEILGGVRVPLTGRR